jgi:hypothetical protein
LLPIKWYVDDSAVIELDKGVIVVWGAGLKVGDHSPSEALADGLDER